MRVNSMLFTGKPISSARSLSQGHLMNKSSVLDELVGKLGQVLPAGAIELKEDFEKNARAAVQSTLAKMDLVTREEFDICLLYTSPSPRDLSTSRMPSSA